MERSKGAKKWNGTSEERLASTGATTGAVDQLGRQGGSRRGSGGARRRRRSSTSAVGAACSICRGRDDNWGQRRKEERGRGREQGRASKRGLTTTTRRTRDTCTTWPAVRGYSEAYGVSDQRRRFTRDNKENISFSLEFMNRTSLELMNMTRCVCAVLVSQSVPIF